MAFLFQSFDDHFETDTQGNLIFFEIKDSCEPLQKVKKDLQKELGLSYLFISHDLRVVRHMADKIAVMYQGKIVEQGFTKSIYEKPKANYTRELLNAIPGNHFKFKVS